MVVLDERVTAMPVVSLATPSLSRRLCLGGAGAVTALSCWPASALSMPVQDLPTPPLDPRPEQPVPLFLNLVTRLAAQVLLEPRRKCLFVLDTGAQATSLSDRLVREMGLRAGPEIMVHGVTASRLVPSALLPRLKLQDEVFENVGAPVFPFEQLGAEGLLGLNHLQAFSLLLDIRNQQAALNPARSYGISYTFGPIANASRILRQMSSVPGHRSDDLLLMTVKVGAVETIAFLDTGAQYSIGNLRLFQALGYTPQQTQERMVYGVSGPPMSVRTGPVPSVQMGAKTLPRTPLLFGDLHIFGVLDLLAQPALLIGADILSRFDRVGIDYHTNRITLGNVMRQRPSRA